MTIELKNLAVKYKDHQVFEDLNLKIPEQAMIAMAGANGIGKSTLLKTLAQLIKPDQGSVVIDQGITYIEQRASFNFDFPIVVKEMVATGLINNPNFVAVDDALTQLKISDLANQQIGQLSAGQLQRVLIARAIVHNKSIWLLDESLNGIDQETQKIILNILKQKVEIEGKTIILSSHDLDNIKKYFDYQIQFDDRGHVKITKVKN